jgi:hypothetical protein
MPQIGAKRAVMQPRSGVTTISVGRVPPETTRACLHHALTQADERDLCCLELDSRKL